MALNEERKIRNLLTKRLERDLQHPSVIWASPAAGMSNLNLIALLRFLEKERSERDNDTR